ncbi:MAG: helix-turn-helix domain-containing protein [Gaiellales bacterium]
MESPKSTRKPTYFERLRAEIDADPVRRERAAAFRRQIDMVDDLMLGIDDRRIELGMSKAELARRVNRDASSIRRLFTSGGIPEINLVAALAEAVGMRITLHPRD